MKYLIPTLLVFLAVAIFAGCSGTPRNSAHDEFNSVYYWKTVFHLGEDDLSFLKRHHVKRVYLRMFDVVEDTYYDRQETNEKVIPNASVKMDLLDYWMLEDSLKELEFVPVVYITLDALKAADDCGDLAFHIVKRVRNMCRYNALPNVRELQLDCDWTSSTEASFFRLCESAKQSIAGLNLPWQLSSTIRLHQLSGKVPPVDRGVLMVYNTGSFNNPDAENSILSMADVKPYLKYLPAYPLHLDVAYPTYSWQLLFRRRWFVGLLDGLNVADTTLFGRMKHNVYVARRDIPYGNRIIYSGDMVRVETSSFTDISTVKAAVEKRLAGRRHSNILYHLDSNNLSKYASDEIDEIFSTIR